MVRPLSVIPSTWASITGRGRGRETTGAACFQGLASHLRAGERPADLGLRIDNLGAAARDALLATMAIGLLLAGAGALLGSLDFPPLALWPRTLRDGVLSGA